MADVCKYEGPRVLLVEGPDDCHVILALCQAHNVPETFGIYQCDGNERLLSRLNALIIRPDALQVIGVVMDADEPDLIGRWQQIQHKIRSHRYTFPNTPSIEGTILPDVPNKPKLGIWLMSR